MNTLEILKKGRELCEQNWIQGEYANYKGGVCAVGGLLVAAGWDEESDPEPVIDQEDALGVYSAYTLLETCLPRNYRVGSGIETYNDEPGRTREEILNLYDCAIEKKEKKGKRTK